MTDDRIVAIGASNRMQIPSGSGVFDGTGKFVIPGLWDMHVHLGAYGDGKKTLRRLLASGITGIRDMASPVDDILRLRKETADGTIAGPRIVGKTANLTVLDANPLLDIANTRRIAAVVLAGKLLQVPDLQGPQ